MQRGPITADHKAEMTSATDTTPPLAPPAPIRWVGAVIRPRGFRHNGKPMHLAVWMTSGGTLLDVAVVSGKGPTLLRRMLDEQLQRRDTSERPSKITVWPSVKASFRDMSFPVVETRKDEFLKVVVEDQCSFGHLPHDAPVRAG